MFHPTLNRSTRILFAPLIKLCEYMGNHHPVILLKIRYYYVFRKKLNLRNPVDLNEKILWAKLFSDTSQWTELADKYKVRKYVESLGLKDILVKLYAVWTKVEDVYFDSLPATFIIKVNNGDGKGTNKIIRKEELTEERKAELLKVINGWLRRKNIGALHAEPQYKKMVPCVIAEEVLPLEPGTTTLTDYKIWCFNGKPHHIWACFNRHQGSVEVATYDLDWKRHDECSIFTSHYKQAQSDLPKPVSLDKMLEIVSKLSCGIPQVRVDLYEVDGKPYFGEMTFSSAGGFMNFYTSKFLREMGDLVDLSLVKRK